MTPEQEAHLQGILDTFVSRCPTKYRAGQAEHGGNLWDLSILQLIDNTIEESVDQFVYLVTVRDKVRTLISFYLSKYGAQHLEDCPAYQQEYWKMRPEYRPTDYGPDKPCTCGLSGLLNPGA